MGQGLLFWASHLALGDLQKSLRLWGADLFFCILGEGHGHCGKNITFTFFEALDANETGGGVRISSSFCAKHQGKLFLGFLMSPKNFERGERGVSALPKQESPNPSASFLGLPICPCGEPSKIVEFGGTLQLGYQKRICVGVGVWVGYDIISPPQGAIFSLE